MTEADAFKPRVIAAGLTPAWQQVLVFERYRQGEVNRAAEAHWCASGKVTNVGLALGAGAADHVRSATVALLGGDTGRTIVEQFGRQSLELRAIETSTPTRVCTTIIDRATNTITELVENARAVTREELDQFCQAVIDETRGAAALVLSGSLPPGTPPEIYAELTRQAGVPVVIDGRGAELMAALAEKPMLVKPNREELGMTVGGAIDDDQSLLAAMRQLCERGAEWVLVTGGAAPLWLVSRHETYRLQPSKVNVVNPIGSGDCLAALMAAGIAQGMSPPEALPLAAAAAIENVRTLLPAQFDDQALVTRASELTVERVA